MGLDHWHVLVLLMPFKGVNLFSWSRSMHLRRLVGVSGLLSYLVVPGGLLAQVAGGVELYGSLDNSYAVTRTLGGLSLSVGTPYLGIRGSGGIGVSSPTPQMGFSQD